MSERKNPILQVEKLSKQFESVGSIVSGTSSDTVIAVKDISFSLHEGEILGLLGRNGAGKTTTIQMLIGTLRPTSGTITYFGKDFESNRSELLQYIAFASGSVQLPALLTVSQNLDIYGRLYGLSKAERMSNMERLLKTFSIWNMRNVKVGYLSSGELTRVMLAKAFLANPRIVLLDEATSALDPEIARQVRRFLRTQRREKGISVVLASHNMAEVAEMCDRVIVVDQGLVIAQDTPAGLVKEITKVRVQFIAGEALEPMKAYLTRHGIVYTLNAGVLEMEIEDSAIPNLLQRFAQENITYSHVSIAKPTLEDYFLRDSESEKEQQ